jgi:hypothetical protein
MSDLFASYGETRAARRNDDRPPPSRTKAPSALEKKMAERDRLSKSYRMMKRQERIETLQREPRLLDFMRYLRRMQADDADDLLQGLREASWLLHAPQDVRLFALGRIARRADKIRLMLGMTPMDDPLPPETSVFFEARDILAAGGRL